MILDPECKSLHDFSDLFMTLALVAAVLSIGVGNRHRLARGLSLQTRIWTPHTLFLGYLLVYLRKIGEMAQSYAREHFVKSHSCAFFEAFSKYFEKVILRL